MASIIFLSITTLLLLLLLPSPAFSQSPSAPAPGPAGPINVTGILVQGGQYTSLLRFLNQTQVLNQIENQLNNSNQGMTLFAPTDNAFLNLPAGTLNGLSEQQKVQLIQYHVLPKYYSLADLVDVSNPVPTQASGNTGGVWGLNFTGQANQVNISTGVVTTQVNNPLRQQFPFAVYQVDKVLIPLRLTEKAPAPEGSSAPSAGNTTKGPNPKTSTVPADGSSPPGNAAGRSTGITVGFVGGVLLFCMAFL